MAGGSSKRQTAPWNDDEVSALVTAVQIYPASSGLDRNVRWKKIAAMVGVGVEKFHEPKLKVLRYYLFLAIAN